MALHSIQLSVQQLEDSAFDRITYLRLTREPRQYLPPLHLAASRNDVEGLARMVLIYKRLTWNINHVYCGYTALDIALRHNHMDAVQFLLEQPGLRVAVESCVIPSVQSAICHSVLELVVLLVQDKRVDLKATGDHGLTSFLYAAKMGRTDCVEALLRLFPEHTVGIANSHHKSMSASFFACYHGYLPMIDVLHRFGCFDCLDSPKVGNDEHLQHVATVTWSEAGGPVYQTPLALAFIRGQRNVLKKLLPTVNSNDILYTLKHVVSHSRTLAMSLPIALKNLHNINEHSHDVAAILWICVFSRRVSGCPHSV